jgi:hypothetical protein
MECQEGSSPVIAGAGQYGFSSSTSNGVATFFFNFYHLSSRSCIPSHCLPNNFTMVGAVKKLQSLKSVGSNADLFPVRAEAFSIKTKGKNKGKGNFERLRGRVRTRVSAPIFYRVQDTLREDGIYYYRLLLAKNGRRCVAELFHHPLRVFTLAEQSTTYHI